ncbi:hypothetical protein [Desulfonatronovibrio hydrogenovorans]|uniref:hypothetical protein n=1 Tax=Desulfonatronovibrio hydrogenovorans TaxID=53245 RepID=UPI0004914D6D|nr:hypothetical protein [Desulfonatronovibrio hydrogenovorans]
MDKLRDEIIETQKVRSDLIKWKLVLTAVLGATGLGFKGSPHDNISLLLCLIPLVCVYVDLTAQHLNLRIQAISSFIRDYESSGSEDWKWMVSYERYAKTISKQAFSFETMVFKYSTMFISTLIILSAIFFYFNEDILKAHLFMFSGLFGMIGSYFIERSYEQNLKTINNIP